MGLGMGGFPDEVVYRSPKESGRLVAPRPGVEAGGPGGAGAVHKLDVRPISAGVAEVSCQRLACPDRGRRAGEWGTITGNKEGAIASTLRARFGLMSRAQRAHERA